MNSKKYPQTFTIDSKVIALLMGIAVVSLFLMAFRYTNRSRCSTVNFSFQTANKNDLAYKGEPVFFSAAVNGADQWEWDFGDKTAVDKKTGPFVSHIYKQPGTYTVRLTVNNNCQEVKTITVNSRERVGKKLVVRVQWPAEPLYAGREYYFADSTEGAENWSWYFDDEPRRSKQALAYQFLEPGMHKVAVVINDDVENNKIEKSFTILPAKQVSPSGGSQRNNSRRTNPSNNNDIQNETSARPLTDYIDKGSSEKNSHKVPPLSDNRLKIEILNIHNAGYNEIRKYLLNNSFSQCTIIFNSRPITVDQLKENIKVHIEYGKDLTVKQETDAENYIKSIEIKAELKPKDRFLLRDKERQYPY